VQEPLLLCSGVGWPQPCSLWYTDASINQEVPWALVSRGVLFFLIWGFIIQTQLIKSLAKYINPNFSGPSLEIAIRAESSSPNHMLGVSGD
jgi:hypothetical protein